MKKNSSRALITRFFIVPVSFTAVISLTMLACQEPATVTANPEALSPKSVEVIEQTASFNWELFRVVDSLASAGENVVISPLSVVQALGMAINGASGENLEEMLSVLGFDAREGLNKAFYDITGLLARADKSVDLLVANSAWYKEGFNINNHFKEALGKYYRASFQPLDFDNPLDAKQVMNSWVSDATRGRIPEIISTISPDHILFLINAVYFKGGWASRFDKELTAPGSFYKGDGTTATVEMMRQTRDLYYFSNGSFSSVRLPYGNGRFVMTVILPREGDGAAEVVNALANGLWEEIPGGESTQKINLALPKFKVEVASDLKPALQAVGINRAFFDEFGFREIADDKIVISDVKHKTFIEVNEQGTEAAAATSIGFVVTSIPVVINFEVNRPFVFVISEKTTGAILFAGKIENPLG